jgi:DNA-binding transcriptional ArsR family regulator
MSKHTSPSATASPLINNEEHLRVSAGIMRALAHPLRMRMVAVIDSKPTAEACVNEIFDALQIEQSVASQHLRILRQSELVKTRRDGKFIYYSLNYGRLDKARSSAIVFSGFVSAG